MVKGLNIQEFSVIVLRYCKASSAGALFFLHGYEKNIVNYGFNHFRIFA